MSYLVTIGADNKSTTVQFVEDAPETLEVDQYFIDAADLPEGAQPMRWIKDGATVRPMTDAEFTAELTVLGNAAAEQTNRAIRDAKLAECDWVVVKSIEAGETVPAAWVTYRQGLRDMPLHTEWPNVDENDWPTKP